MKKLLLNEKRIEDALVAIIDAAMKKDGIAVLPAYDLIRSCLVEEPDGQKVAEVKPVE